MSANEMYKKITFWMTLLGVVSLVFAVYTVHGLSARQIELSEKNIREEAVALFETVVLVRAWAASHGGVYVKQKPGLKPNPYLKNNTLKSEKGETLILMNPAWITRQLFTLKQQKEPGGHYYKITSLRPVNPANAPDEFEKRALWHFEKNRKQEFYFEFPENETDKMFFMGSLPTEKACLGCHENYKVGDIRGGIRITVPIQDYRERVDLIHKNELYIDITIAIIIATMGFLIHYLFRTIQSSHDQVELMNAALEAKVAARTKDVNSLYKKERYLRDIMETVALVNKEIIAQRTLDKLLERVCRVLATHSHYGLCSLTLVENKRVERTIVSNDEFGVAAPLSFNRKDIMYTHPGAQAVLKSRMVLIESVQTDTRIEPWRDRLLKAGYNSLVAFPLYAAGKKKVLGVMQVYTSRVESFESEELEMLYELAGDVGFAVDVYRRRSDLEKLKAEKIRNFEETILSFVQMIEERDSYTAGHSVRVAGYCARIGAQMKLSKADIDKLEKASILHDIGKVATPDSILLRPGKLSPVEYDLIKGHVESGYGVLSTIKIYKDLAEIIRYHHEWHNGKGYPHGIKGDEIPPLSRILIVADAFDAMTTDRVYHTKLSVKEALAELQRQSGVQFNPEVVKAAVEALGDLVIPQTSIHFPVTNLDKKRFAYFFSDRLTDLFNEDYYNLLIHDKAKLAGIKRICFLSVSRFTAYNEKYGWEKGDQLLIAVARELRAKFPNDLVFRVQGDDFIILLRTKEKSEQACTNLESLKEAGLNAVIHVVEIGSKKAEKLEINALRKL